MPKNIQKTLAVLSLALVFVASTGVAAGPTKTYQPPHKEIQKQPPKSPTTQEAPRQQPMPTPRPMPTPVQR